MKLAFALIGLYLHIERGYSGREVQLAHMKMGKTKNIWPKFELPADRGKITVTEVLKAQPGFQRNEMVDKWSECVWQAWLASRGRIAHLAKIELDI